MASMPINNVIPLEGGSLVCGMVVVYAIQAWSSHGLSWRLVGDQDRQRSLITLCMAVVVAGIISLGLNQTKAAFILQDIVVLIIFWGVQLGLCCINHNTIIRIYIALSSSSSRLRPQKLSLYCLALYPLTILVLLPIFMGFPSTIAAKQGLNTSDENKQIFKPLNVGLVIATEVFATVSDILLLMRVGRARGATVSSSQPLSQVEIAGSAPVKRSSTTQQMRASMWKHYALVWVLVILDVILKILIFLGYPVLFDSQVTNATILLRAVTNLEFGISLSKVYGGASTQKSQGEVLSATTSHPGMTSVKNTGVVTKGTSVQPLPTNGQIA
ncbi:uncharacterized protein EV422DRAFT_313809 [Fimicolochytrium jonesii]|uniref:uncharacterized protein n=1 Tax=Fimicolochytrium jonesii TaxID=1396493 RepID=UPI0022FE7453|nr:uncharacterized protein EV422DRAFT_313809 [Fimicolochytrium jonesii]KAI8824274.1 hypothetical protein EV422DRAFT_313809 [Fimicolochytrium jonesii]